MRLMQLLKNIELYVVHDTAQSIGSIYKGKKTGTIADVSTFSFHGTKNLTTGEGGALTTMMMLSPKGLKYYVKKVPTNILFLLITKQEVL